MLDSWEKIIDNNFINAELIGDIGAERVVTIKDIDWAECFNPKTNTKEQKIACFFEECKPMILNKTNSKTLKKLFGGSVDNPSMCIGKKIVLYVISVQVGKNVTTGIRIKEYSEELCADCGQPIKPTSTKSVKEMIEISKRNCGRQLCAACMRAEYERQKGETA